MAENLSYGCVRYARSIKGGASGDDDERLMEPRDCGFMRITTEPMKDLSASSARL